MAKLTKAQANTIGVIVSALFLVALAFLPALIRKKHYEVDILQAQEPAVFFPMDKAFPVIAVQGDEGRTTTLGELAKGRPAGLLVNFWATWCPPCLEELPSLEFLHRQLEGAPELPGLVTISVDEQARSVPTLYGTLDFEPSFLVLHDSLGDFSASVGTTKFPETYWIRPSGELVYKWVGPQHWLSEKVLGQVKARLSASSP